MLTFVALRRILERRPPEPDAPTLPPELLHMRRVVDEVAPAVIDQDADEDRWLRIRQNEARRAQHEARVRRALGEGL